MHFSGKAHPKGTLMFHKICELVAKIAPEGENAAAEALYQALTLAQETFTPAEGAAELPVTIFIPEDESVEERVGWYLSCHLRANSYPSPRSPFWLLPPHLRRRS